mmetsp:Transcript_103744/g.203453  ORF Transcript_103744/g.203453 Transcript_103744/m.203453 type:complete len:128 (-) Transcript_103744:76-459(-)
MSPQYLMPFTSAWTMWNKELKGPLLQWMCISDISFKAFGSAPKFVSRALHADQPCASGTTVDTWQTALPKSRKVKQMQIFVHMYTSFFTMMRQRHSKVKGNNDKSQTQAGAGTAGTNEAKMSCSFCG